jgi:hypothetical protein
VFQEMRDVEVHAANMAVQKTQVNAFKTPVSAELGIANES